MQMVRPEAPPIDFVDVFSPGRTRREPSAFRNHLQAANRCAIAWRTGEDSLDLLAGKLCGPDLLRRKPLQHLLLRRSGPGFNAIVKRLAQRALAVGVALARVAASTRHALRASQCGDDDMRGRRPTAP